MKILIESFSENTTKQLKAFANSTKLNCSFDDILEELEIEDDSKVQISTTLNGGIEIKNIDDKMDIDKLILNMHYAKITMNI